MASVQAVAREVERLTIEAEARLETIAGEVGVEIPPRPPRRRNERVVALESARRFDDLTRVLESGVLSALGSLRAEILALQDAQDAQNAAQSAVTEAEATTPAKGAKKSASAPPEGSAAAK